MDSQSHYFWLIHYSRYLKAALSYWRDKLTQARDAALAGETLARELGDKKLLANTLCYLGRDIYRELNELDNATCRLQESITLYREINHLSRLSIALTSLGVVLHKQNKRCESAAVIREALEITIRENDLWGKSYAMRVQADNLHFEGNFSEALPAFKRALDISLAIEDRVSVGMILANMSLLANVLEDYPASGKYAESALATFQAIGNEYQQPFPMRMMAYSALYVGECEHARALCIESLKGNHALGHKTGVLACLLTLANIKAVRGNLIGSAELFAFAKRQLQAETPNMLEPDRFSLERLESNLKKTLGEKKFNKIVETSEELEIEQIYKNFNIDPLEG